MATVAEMNSAFDAMHKWAEETLMPQVPFMFRSSVREYLDSAEGRKALLDGGKHILEAAEKARAVTT